MDAKAASHSVPQRKNSAKPSTVNPKSVSRENDNHKSDTAERAFHFFS